MKKQKIWIVSEVFYPDETSTAYIMTSIAENLGKFADVHVLCGPDGYGSITNQTKNLQNVTIHRLNLFNFNKNNIFLRLLRVILLSFGMFFFGLFKIQKEDKLILVTNPAFSIPLFSFLKKLKGFSYYILVHDVFPENLIPARIIKSKSIFLYKCLKYLFNSSYKKADKLLVLGRDMETIMREKTSSSANITIIENWADLKNINPLSFQNNELITLHKLQDKIVFLFAGNLGRVQGLEYLLEIISTIKNDLIHFLFIGEGALLSELKSTSNKNELRNVSFLGTFPRTEQSKFLNASHFGVVTLEEEVVGLGVPSKSYNIMAAGKPIFFIGNQNSEIALMLKQYSCGVTFSMHQKQEIINFLNHLNKNNLETYLSMGALGREIAESHYSKETILLKFKNVILNGY